MPCHARGHQLLLLFCILLKYCHAVKNDATEMMDGHIIPPVHETPTNVSLNRARNGGRSFDTGSKLDQSQVGCRELRSTKYISDGQCTSLSPVKELVCAGECLPAHLLPNWIGASYSGRYWTRRDAQEWRCVTDRTRTQRIRLQCLDGSTRTYKIQAVTACKCKRYSRQHNDSMHKGEGTGTGTGTSTGTGAGTGIGSTQPQPSQTSQSQQTQSQSQNQNQPSQSQPNQHKKRRNKNPRNRPAKDPAPPRTKP